MRRRHLLLVLLPALALAACSGESPSTRPDHPAGTESKVEPTPVFDDGFETGETEVWSEDQEAREGASDEEGPSE